MMRSAVWVGAPYREGARGPDAYDCFGLVRSVFVAYGGIELPSYGEISAADLASVADAIGGEVECGQWLPVDPVAVCDLDVVAMAGRVKLGGLSRRLPVHCGIVLDGRLLHTEPGLDAVSVPLDDRTVRHRILGLYRHEALA